MVVKIHPGKPSPRIPVVGGQFHGQTVTWPTRENRSNGHTLRRARGKRFWSPEAMATAYAVKLLKKS